MAQEEKETLAFLKNKGWVLPQEKVIEEVDKKSDALNLLESKGWIPTAPPAPPAIPPPQVPPSPILPPQHTPFQAPASIFDPEGLGYDFESAQIAGLKPDESGHWPSRDPKTGLILKGMNHPTIDKTLAEEEKLGYKIYKRDGRYYSQAPTAEELDKPTFLKIIGETLGGAAQTAADTMYGAIEGVQALVTGIPSYLAGVGAQAGLNLFEYVKENIENLYQYGTVGVGLEDTEGMTPKDILDSTLERLGRNKTVKEKVATLGTFVPQTEMGQGIAEGVAYPFSLFLSGVEKLAESFSDDPAVQDGVMFVGDVALIYGVPKVKAFFTKQAKAGRALKLENLESLAKEIGESKNVPLKVKAEVRRAAKGKQTGYPFFPKDAPQVWRDVYDVTGGQGIRPFKDPVVKGKFLELEEYRSGVPKQLRRKNGLPPDEVADMLGFESSKELYNALEWTKKKPEMEKPIEVVEAETKAFEGVEKDALLEEIARERELRAERSLEVREERMPPSFRPVNELTPKELLAEKTRLNRLKKDYTERIEEIGEERIAEKLIQRQPLEERLRATEEKMEAVERRLKKQPHKIKGVKEPADLFGKEIEIEKPKAKVPEPEEVKLFEAPEVVAKFPAGFDSRGIKLVANVNEARKIAQSHMDKGWKLEMGQTPENKGWVRLIEEGKPGEGELNYIAKARKPEFLEKPEIEYEFPEERHKIVAKEKALERITGEEVEIRKAPEAAKIEGPLEMMKLKNRADESFTYDEFLKAVEKKEANAMVKKAGFKSLKNFWEESQEVREYKVRPELLKKKKPEKIEIKEKEVAAGIPEEIAGKEGYEYIAEIDKMKKEVETKQRQEYPKVGLSVKLTEALPKKEVFKFVDSQVEQRFQAAKGIPKPPLPQRAKDLLISFKNKVTRTYEHLPNTGEFIEVKQNLKRLAKQGGRTFDTTMRTLHGITIKLGKRTQDVFRRKVILDDLTQGVELGQEVPFGFTKEALRSELGRIDSVIKKTPEIKDALTKRNGIWEALKNDYLYWAKKVGVNLEGKLTKANYFRHQVLEYAKAKGIFQTGKRLKVPPKRGFLKERKGSEFDINTDYFEAESEVMAQMLYDIEIYKTIDRIREAGDISKEVKKTAKAKKMADWHEAIPDGYVPWQPREGNVFYLADTIPAKIADQILSGALEDMKIVKSSLNKSLSMGRQRLEWVVKEEVAKTLNDLTQKSPPNWLSKASKKILRGWKIWTLISPRKLPKYNIRNLTGDADAVFVGNPEGFKKSGKAINDLTKLYSANEPMSIELQEWFNRGGMESTLQAQELGNIKSLRLFQKFYESKGGLKQIPMKVWKKYWRTARLTTDFRESILRYANYLDYLDQIKKSPEGKPKNFGASLREEIMALKDPRDKAFRLSNELLGAYDEISVFGQAIRDHIYPFWSWKELNFRRYVRFAKNAAKDNSSAMAAGRSLAGKFVRSPYRLLKIGRFAIKATALWGMLQAWNHLFFPEEEEGLSSDVKGRTHIIVGKGKEGKTRHFTRIGALGDFLEWFGLDAAPNLVSDFTSGKKSLKDIVETMAKAPINQVVQGLSPFIKTPMEIATRRALFPDAFSPKTIRDRGMHIARSLGLENEYKAIAGKPSDPYVKSFPLAFIYESDPLQSAYYEIFSLKNEFQKKSGKRGEGFWLTPRGSALYDMKLAYRYGDKKAAEKYLREYMAYHFIESKQTKKPFDETLKSIEKGISASIKNMHPLSGMSKRGMAAFLVSLDEEDRELLAKAIRFYNDTLLGTTKIKED